jgi:hypothetical protein
MTGIPTITENTIRDLVGEASFQRGQRYFRNNQIFDTQRAGMSLKAKCEGSRSIPYRVETIFNEAEIETTDCSCPIGGYCKHVVALLLTWLARPETFPEQQNIEGILQECDKDELITLIKQMLRQNPDLEYLVLTTSKAGAPTDPQFYRNQVETIFRNAGGEWGTVPEIADALRALQETGATFTQRQDYASAIAVSIAISEGVADHFEDYREQDEAGELESVVLGCVTGLKQCLEAQPEDNSLREQILHTLFTIYRFDIEAGNIRFGEDAPGILVHNTTPEELRLVAGWVREAIATCLKKEPHVRYVFRQSESFSFEEEVDLSDRYVLRCWGSFLLDLEEETIDDSTYLQVCRETGLLTEEVELLLDLDRVKEAEQATQRASDYDLLNLAQLFRKYNQQDLITRLIQERSWKSQDKRLHDWVRKQASLQSDQTEALVRATDSFQEMPTLATYKKARLLATQAGHWEHTKNELRAFLKSGQHYAVLTQVALDENDLDEIISLVQSTNPSTYNETSRSILATIEEEEIRQPEASLHFYRRYAASLINNRNRHSYEQASRIIQRIQSLYIRLGQRAAWTRYITRIHEQNRGLKALQSILTDAEL